MSLTVLSHQIGFLSVKVQHTTLLVCQIRSYLHTCEVNPVIELICAGVAAGWVCSADTNVFGRKRAAGIEVESAH